jgi:hypothetical protein
MSARGQGLASDSPDGATSERPFQLTDRRVEPAASLARADESVVDHTDATLVSSPSARRAHTGTSGSVSYGGPSTNLTSAGCSVNSTTRRQLKLRVPVGVLEATLRQILDRLTPSSAWPVNLRACDVPTSLCPNGSSDTTDSSFWRSRRCLGSERI